MASCLCFYNRFKYIVLATYIAFWVKALILNSNSVQYTMPEIFHKVKILRGDSHKGHKDYCRLQWNDLRLQTLNIFEHRSMEEIEHENPSVLPGGRWAPDDCVPFQSVAIVIPYRDRMLHLRQLVRRLHPMLRRQKIEYQIFVIEQTGKTRFNRGMLMNVGLKEALARNTFDCFIFHDVDLLPEHDRNIYLCDDHVRHLASAIDEMRYHVMFENYAGGVVALTTNNMYKINGYPNIYWGWGNEDDDFSARTMVAGIKLTRPPEFIGRYKMVKHVKAERNDEGYDLFRGFRGRQYHDGLNSLKPNSSYNVLSYREMPLYTNLTVNLVMPPKLIPDNWPKTQESFFWFFKFYGWWIN